MDALIQDLRYALRTLARAPLYTLVAVVTVALGIGANTAIFSVVNGVLMRPLPYSSPDELVMVWGRYPDFGRTSTSLPDFLDWRARATTVRQMAAVNATSFNLSGLGEPERVQGQAVTANFFETLGVEAGAGRLFAAGEDRADAPRVVVLSHGYWMRRFGGRRDVIGQTLNLSGTPRTVIGVAPSGFSFLQPADAWVPLDLDMVTGRRSEFLTVFGRLAPGRTGEQAQGEMRAVLQGLAKEYPNTNASLQVEVLSMHADLVGDVRSALLAFMAAVGLVLLIACTNVASLALTRAASREREIAVRAALGAGRGRIVRQMLVESAVVGLAGGTLGVLLAAAGLAALRRWQGELIPRMDEIAIDARVLAFALAASLLTGLLFGLAPALQMGRRALSGALRGGGRGMAGDRGVARLRGGLVALEVGLALALLVGTGLLLRSFGRLQGADTGVETRGVLTAQLSLPLAQYPDAAARRAFQGRLEQSLRGVPGLGETGLMNNVPLSGRAGYETYSIEGRPDDGSGSAGDAQPFGATPGALRALQVAVLEGRAFTDGDDAEAPRVALVNQTLARQQWPGRSPLGSRISFNPADSTAWMTVVGVVADTRVEGMDQEPYAQIYAPLAQRPSPSTFVVARPPAGAPERAVPSLRGAVGALDPTLPLYNVATLDQRVAESVARPRVGTRLLALFAAVAMLLAAVGIYGLIAYGVAQRTRELGVRIALGATASQVVRMTVRQGLLPALIGIAGGMVVALVGVRLIRSLLYGVSPLDPVAFAAAPVLLALVALAAAYLPARRAARVDPMTALRSE